jgi:hypothetical protein
MAWQVGNIPADAGHDEVIDADFHCRASQRLSLLFQWNVEFTVLPLYQQQQSIFILCLADRIFDIVNRFYSISIHFDDDITLADTSLGGRAFRIDPDDSDTLVGTDAVTLFHLRAEFMQLHAPFPFGGL